MVLASEEEIGVQCLNNLYLRVQIVIVSGDYFTSFEAMSKPVSSAASPEPSSFCGVYTTL
ncbi:MAG: hypothetical protein ACJAS1_000428 [Oleiphilaceae bacterium]|jgi:hypothetical protein